VWILIQVGGKFITLAVVSAQRPGIGRPGCHANALNRRQKQAIPTGKALAGIFRRWLR